MRKIITLFTLIFILFSSFALGLSLKDIPVGRGYAAKNLCSYIFNSGISEDTALNQFIKPKVFPLPYFWKVNIDYDNQQISISDAATVFRSPATAFNTPGKGCTLLVDRTREEIKSIPFKPNSAPIVDPIKEWPLGSAVASYEFPEVNREKLDKAITTLFEKQELLKTTSALIVYKGKLIAEKYDLGYSKDSPTTGWSMTKSITGMLIGLLEKQGRVALDEPAPIPQWKNTEYEKITVRHLLTMTSGLFVEEDYTQYSEVTQMLYLTGNQYEHALSQKQVYQPGTHFEYSTAETNRLAAVVHAEIGDQQAVYDFYQKELFHPLGINSGIIEFDAYGQLVGGAYGFMKPRDWARLGLLYLNKGNWFGKQILTEGFVEFVTKPSTIEPTYGGQVWINHDRQLWPSLPEDAYYFSGHQGQRVIMIPSKQLLIVRTGVTEDNDLLKKELDLFLGEVITLINN